MQGRNWIMIGIAAMLGLIAVVIANAYFSGVQDKRENVTRQQQLTQIVVASQPLDFGMPIADQNVRLQAWPASSVPQGAFRTIAEAKKNNRMVLRPMVPGEPVLASKVSGTDGRATLAALLPDGMRAVSISVNAVTGVSGFVLPGTLVDVIVTRKIPGEGATSEDYRSDVVLENVQVLAIDQIADDKKGDPKVSKTATLQVSLYDAQRLIIAEKIGDLSLALRKVEGAVAPGAQLAQTGSRTITNRNLGGPRYYIPQRQQRGTMMAGGFAAPAGLALQAPGGNAQAPISGPSMMVYRGVESTTYPVGRNGGW